MTLPLILGGVKDPEVRYALETLARFTNGPDFGRWQSYSPSWTNVTVGNGTAVTRYALVGKTVFYKVDLICGSTTSISGTVSLTLPITATLSATANRGAAGWAKYTDDSASASYNGDAELTSSTTIGARVFRTDGTYSTRNVVNGTAPFTWATTDELFLQGFYEAA